MAVHVFLLCQFSPPLILVDLQLAPPNARLAVWRHMTAGNRPARSSSATGSEDGPGSPGPYPPVAPAGSYHGEPESDKPVQRKSITGDERPDPARNVLKTDRDGQDLEPHEPVQRGTPTRPSDGENTWVAFKRRSRATPMNGLVCAVHMKGPPQFDENAGRIVADEEERVCYGGWPLSPEGPR